MKFIKILLIFALGGVAGLGVGGYLGYHVGSTNQAIKYAPAVGMVPVQEEHRPAQIPAPKPAADAVPEPAPVATPPVTEELPAAAPDNVPADVPPTAPAEVTAAEPAVAGGGVEEFNITPNDQSQIMWVGYKEVAGVQMSMEGGFANFQGKLTVEANDAAKSFVEVLVDMKSIFSSNSILTTVLKSEAFFKTSEFPQARFASTKIEPSDNGYMVTGNFTMKGVTQGIQFPAVIERRDNGVYAKAEFKVDRKMWDVGYDNYEDSLILKEVVISFEILAEPAA